MLKLRIIQICKQTVQRGGVRLNLQNRAVAPDAGGLAIIKRGHNEFFISKLILPTGATALGFVINRRSLQAGGRVGRGKQSTLTIAPHLD